MTSSKWKMILATSSDNVSAWRKVFDQSEKRNENYSDWSKNQGRSATWFGTYRIESTLFSDIKSQRKTENIALVEFLNKLWVRFMTHKLLMIIFVQKMNSGTNWPQVRKKKNLWSKSKMIMTCKFSNEFSNIDSWTPPCDWYLI